MQNKSIFGPVVSCSISYFSDNFLLEPVPVSFFETRILIFLLLELTNGGRDGLWQRIKSLDYDMNNNLSFGVQDLLSKIFCPAELRISLETIQDHWWVRRGYKREDIRKMKKMHLEESRHPSDRQTQQELYHLIEQALIPPKHMLDEIDDFMQF